MIATAHQVWNYPLSSVGSSLRLKLLRKWTRGSRLGVASCHAKPPRQRLALVDPLNGLQHFVGCRKSLGWFFVDRLHDKLLEGFRAGAVLFEWHWGLV